MAVEATADLRKQTMMAGMQTRRLALDLRMLSIGLSMVERNIGETSPAISSMISGIQLASGAVSVIVAGASLLTRGMTYVRGGAKATGSEVGLLGTLAAKTGLSTMGLATALTLATAAGVAAYQMTFDAVSGIKGLRAETRALKLDLEGLTLAMTGLKTEQASVTAEQRKYRFIIESTKRAMDEGTLSTEEGERLLEVYEAAAKQAGMEAMRLGWRLADEGAMAARSSAQIEQYNFQIKEAQRAPGRAFSTWWQRTTAGARPGGMPIPLPPGGVPGAQGGGMVRQTGLIFAHAGELMLQPEQITQAVEVAAGGPVYVPVNISLAGANITGIGDFIEALGRAGDEAGSRARRQLEFLRRPRIRSRM